LRKLRPVLNDPNR